MSGGPIRRRAAPARARARREEVPGLSKFGYLSAAELFGGLPGDELEEIERAATMRTSPAGTVCYTPGETGERLFILKRGKVRIYRLSPEGRKLVTAELRAPSFFGEMEILGQGMYDSFAEASTDSLLCTMTRADVERLILPRPRVVRQLLRGIGKRMAEVERMLEDAAFKGLLPRIASLLLREAAGNVVAGLSHQDIADRLGVYRESVTVALNEMRLAGMIEIARKRISIVDRLRLERAALG